MRKRKTVLDRASVIAPLKAGEESALLGALDRRVLRHLRQGRDVARTGASELAVLLSLDRLEQMGLVERD